MNEFAILIVALSSIGFSAAGGAENPPAEQSIEVTLSPIQHSGAITSVEVLEVITGWGTPDGQSILQVPVRVTTVMGQVYADGDVKATDASGASFSGARPHIRSKSAPKGQ